MRNVNELRAPVLVNPPARELGARHAILHGRGRVHHVREFEGPLSIKSVVRGSALWETADGRARVDASGWIVLNDRQRYALTIESREEVETLCVFFRRGFVEDVRRALTTADARLLDEPNAAPAPHRFFEHLRPHDARVSPELRRLHRAVLRGGAGAAFVDERLAALARALLASQRELGREIARVPAARADTREELFRRASLARDFMEASLGEPLDLERIARVAFLSPFHFHRTFAALFRETPHRYVVRRRLERARELIERTDRRVTDVCFDVGFESLGSFSALFRRAFGASPREMRSARRGRRAPPPPPSSSCGADSPDSS